jgi:hypothetical protein
VSPFKPRFSGTSRAWSAQLDAPLRAALLKRSRPAGFSDCAAATVGAVDADADGSRLPWAGRGMRLREEPSALAAIRYRAREERDRAAVLKT